MPVLIVLIAGICAIKTGAHILNEDAPPAAHWIVFATAIAFALLGAAWSFIWDRTETAVEKTEADDEVPS